MTGARTEPLVAVLWPSGLIRDAVIVLAGTVLLAVCASMRVPMWPVPMTMQTFAVMLIGAGCGARLGTFTILTYLAAAAAGFPVLAGGRPLIGAGPTFGYLIGFVLAAIASGWLSEHGWARGARLLAALVVGQALIYFAGLAWLNFALLHDWGRTLQTGLLPFLPGAAAKIALAAILLDRVRARLP